MRIWKHLASPLVGRPLTLIEEDSDSGFRVGGHPPEGVVPPHIGKETRYFITLPLDEDDSMEVSLFLSLSKEEGKKDSLTKNMYSYHDETRHLVEFVVHRAAKRAKDSKLRSEIEPHSWRIEAEHTDSPVYEDDNLWTHHKIGGLPFFYHEYPEILAEADRLVKSGWVHLLQMTSLGYDDADIHGDWPIWNQMFHVFMREEGGKCEFRYVFA